MWPDKVTINTGMVLTSSLRQQNQQRERKLRHATSGKQSASNSYNTAGNVLACTERPTDSLLIYQSKPQTEKNNEKEPKIRPGIE